jgi:hypothetical protein
MAAVFDGGSKMQTVKYIHWQEGGAWLCYLQAFGLSKGAYSMKRFMMAAVGIVFAGLSAVAWADDLELKAAGPHDKDLQTVLRYTGDDVALALAAGNNLKDTKKLNELVVVDAKDPTIGTFQWQAWVLKRKGKTLDRLNTDLGKGISIQLKRKDKDATDWELTEDSKKLVRRTVAECR